MVGHFSVATGVNIDQNENLEHLAREDDSLKEEQVESDIDSESAESTNSTDSSELTTQEKVYNYFEDTPILYHVAKCESRWRQYDKQGNPLRGNVDRRDVGVMQINEYYHLKQAQKLGFNIYTLEGNVAYAKYLYKNQGLKPWYASKPCWGGETHLAAVE